MRITETEMFFLRGRFRQRREQAGSAVAETGPALFILLILVFFPLVDLLYMGLAFGIVWYLNFLEVRELSVRVPDQTAQALSDVDTVFLQQGMGKFVGLTAQAIQHPLPGMATRAGTPPQVTCTTQATVKPFLTLPFLIPVAGMNAPVTFTVTSSTLQEELGVNG